MSPIFLQNILSKTAAPTVTPGAASSIGPDSANLLPRWQATAVGTSPLDAMYWWDVLKASHPWRGSFRLASPSVSSMAQGIPSIPAAVAKTYVPVGRTMGALGRMLAKSPRWLSTVGRLSGKSLGRAAVGTAKAWPGLVAAVEPFKERHFSSGAAYTSDLAGRLGTDIIPYAGPIGWMAQVPMQTLSAVTGAMHSAFGQQDRAENSLKDMSRQALARLSLIDPAKRVQRMQSSPEYRKAMLDAHAEANMPMHAIQKVMDPHVSGLDLAQLYGLSANELGQVADLNSPNLDPAIRSMMMNSEAAQSPEPATAQAVHQLRGLSRDSWKGIGIGAAAGTMSLPALLELRRRIHKKRSGQ